MRDCDTKDKLILYFQHPVTKGHNGSQLFETKILTKKSPRHVSSTSLMRPPPVDQMQPPRDPVT